MKIKNWFALASLHIISGEFFGIKLNGKYKNLFFFIIETEVNNRESQKLK